MPTVTELLSQEFAKRGFPAAPLSSRLSREFYRRGWPEKYRWITIGGDKGAPSGERHGTPVDIDQSGRITKGPSALTGKDVGNLSQPAKVAMSSEHKEAARKSLMTKGEAKHGETTVKVVPHSSKLGWAAEASGPGGTTTHGEPQTTFNEAIDLAHKELVKREGAGFALSSGQAPKQEKLFSPDEMKEAKRTTRKADEPAKDFGAGVQSLPDGRKVGVTQLKVSDLAADPTRFQYKISGIGEEGVTEELKEVKRFRPEFAGQLLVWHDPKDNKTYVINGHHRFELAQRSGYDGHLSVFMINAENAKEARAMGAMANIAEGRGSALDAGKFLRESGMTLDDVATQGISLKGKVADDGVAISKLSDKLFRSLAGGQMREGRALAIARELGGKPELQDKLAGILEKRDAKGRDLPDAVVHEMAREMAQTPTKTETHTDLFGSFEDERSLFVERNELKAAVRKELSEQANAFRAVSSEQRAERLGTAGNVIHAEQNQQLAQEARGNVWMFDQLINSKGVLSDAFNAAAEQLAANPRGRKNITRDLAARLSELLEADQGGKAAYSRRLQTGAGLSATSGDRRLGGPEPLKELFAREFARRGFGPRTLRELFSREFERRGWQQPERYAGQWDEGKHPRANDGRFGSKAGQHDSQQEPQQPPAQAEAQQPQPVAAAPQGQPAGQQQPASDASLAPAIQNVSQQLGNLPGKVLHDERFRTNNQDPEQQTKASALFRQAVENFDGYRHVLNMGQGVSRSIGAEVKMFDSPEAFNQGRKEVEADPNRT